MNKNDLISIIVPVYNGKTYLESCLRSILNNSYKDIELIIVNDGSKDNSNEICKRIKEEDSRVKYYEKTNGGIVSARNFGLERAKGEYICFADQDDQIPENAYEILHNNIIQNNSQMCLGSYKILYENTRIDCFQIEKEMIYNSKKDIVDNLIIPTIENVNRKIENVGYKNIRWNIWNCMYSKKYLDEFDIKFIKYLDYEDDLLFNLEFYRHARIISTTDKIVYYWRKNLKSTSNSKRYVNNYWENAIKLKEYYLNLLKESEIDEYLFEKYKKRIEERLYLDYLYNECNSKAKDSVNIRELKKTYEKVFDKYNVEKLNKIDFKYDVINTNDYFVRKKLNKKKVKIAYYHTKYIHNMILIKFVYIYRCLKLIRRR